MIRTSSVTIALFACALAGAALPLGCSSTTDASGSAGTSSSGGSTAHAGTSSGGGTSAAGTNAGGAPGASGTYGAGGSAAGSVGFAGTGGTSAGGTSSGGTGAAGSTSTGGSTSNGGSAGGTAAGGSGGSTNSGCDTPGLTWKSANKTNYTSYPDPGSEECIKFNGCAYEGQFAACDKTESKAWVSSHNIVSVFPDLNKLALHDLCLKSGSKTIVVTVLDECADSDCSGCCTQNKGNKDELIDIESFTDARWGVDDGPIQWADLGPTKGMGCN